jgi:hypothetical protein
MSKRFTFQGVLEAVEANLTFQTSKGDNLVKSYITFDDTEEYNGKTYNNKIIFELFGAERAKIADTLVVGHTYEVRFSINSRKYNNSVFSTNSAFEVVDVTARQQATSQAPQTMQTPPPPMPNPIATDDLPF